MKSSDKKGAARQGKTIKAGSAVKRKPAAGNGAIRAAVEENKEIDVKEQGNIKEHATAQVSDKGLSQMESLEFEVLDYAGKHKGELNGDLFIKGLATGILLLFGIRKSGIAGSIAVFAAASIITTYIIENAAKGSYNAGKVK